MKKIVFVIADLGMGGAQRVISLLADILSAQVDTQVDIVTMGDDATRSFFTIPGNVKIHRGADATASKNSFSAFTANIKRIKNLRKALIGLQPDVVISFQTETNCTVLLAMAGAGVPVIVSERSDPYIHPHSTIWRSIRRLVYPLAAGAVFQTAHAARFFAGVVKNKAVIFNPVSIDHDMSAVVPAGPYILGVGRLSKEKGFDTLIAAHARALTSCPDLTLVLIGDGPEKAALMVQAQILGTADRIVFAGSQNQLAEYYSSALAFVLPSQFEGLPNALLEAMAYGCVAISTPLFAAAPEIISHGQDGLIAASGSAEDLAQSIIYCYENREQCRALGQQAKISAARFDSHNICQEWLRFINSVI